jgi:prepilin-type N-terminal cleavage/methylation domain-containing protein
MIGTQRDSQAGMTLLEVMIAITVIAFGALATISSLVGSSGSDRVVRDRTVALRALKSQMERVMAFDYHGDIQELVAHFGDPANAVFSVSELRSPAGGGRGGVGSIVVDAGDPDRIGISVSVSWMGLQGVQTLVMPFTMTELTP